MHTLKSIHVNLLHCPGGTVVMACRDETQGKQAAEFVRKETENMDVYFSKLDLNSFKSIKDFVERFKKSMKLISFISFFFMGTYAM